MFDHSSGYFPRSGLGGCQDDETRPSLPSVFDNFFAWNVDKGAESTLTGAVRFKNFLVVGARREGITMFETYGSWGDKGPGTKATL